MQSIELYLAQSSAQNGIYHLAHYVKPRYAIASTHKCTSGRRTHVKRLYLSIMALLLATPLVAQDNAAGQRNATDSQSSGRSSQLELGETNLPNIRLSKIDDRHWLIGSDGKPFFAHGITHIGNARSKHDFMDVATACKRLGFNAFGYRCPPELRSDMPYLESWNDLVPISMYRSKDGGAKAVVAKVPTSLSISLIPKNKLVSKRESKRTVSKARITQTASGIAGLTWPLGRWRTTQK